MYSTKPLTSKLNGSSVTTTQSSRVGHLTAVDTNIRFCQDIDSQHVTSFTESDGVVVHPSVGVAAHGDASGDSADEGGGVSHHNPRESCCDLHLWWYCSGGKSDRTCIIRMMMSEYYMEVCRLLQQQYDQVHDNVCL